SVCQNRLHELGLVFEELFVVECGGSLEKFEALLRGYYGAPAPGAFVEGTTRQPGHEVVRSSSSSSYNAL
ncbi:unnamed protein product, partial [Amoebophrya sp. A25]